MPPRWIERVEKGEARGRETRERVAMADASLEALEDHLTARKLAKVKPPSRPWLIDPPKPEGISEALARLAAHATPQLWTCSIRDELVAQGYVEITVGKDGRWTGDKITDAGLAKARIKPGR